MKILALVPALFLIGPLTASAATINLTPGSSTTIESIVVNCGGGESQGLLFACDCYDIGRAPKFSLCELIFTFFRRITYKLELV